MRDFGFGQGGESGISPQWAMTEESTQAQVKRSTARRVLAGKAGIRCCFSVTDPQGIGSFSAPSLPAFHAKTGPLGIFRQALSTNTASGPTLEFEDTEAPSHPRRFYRARMLSPP